MKHFLSYLQDSLQTKWNNPSLTDFHGTTDYTLGQVAEQMARLGILFDLMGIEAGDKVSLCGRNCANWGVAFLALTASRRVAVSILPDFTPESVASLVNHSESKMFFASSQIWQSVSSESMPNLRAVVLLEDFSLAYASDDKVQQGYDRWSQAFTERYPSGYSVADVDYPVDNLDELALINYTSGTTSAPKGVMLSYGNLSSNIQAGFERLPIRSGDKMVSILPMAHMFGLALEFLYETVAGVHIYFLLKTPTPQLLLKAFEEIRPFMIVTVPLVLEKIFRKNIFPRLKKPLIHRLWSMPVFNLIIRAIVRRNFIKTFGGNLRYIMIGGAALNREVEMCMKQLGLPYIVGYGMTECAPLIAYEDWDKFVPTSCGKAVPRMEIRIQSDDPEHTPGEIQTRGANLMMGYYHNEEATRQAFTPDGWLHTGDMGILDSKGNLFIKGRCKNMILGPSGQNIYPEEIEDKLNSLPLIVESLVVDRGGKLIALVYADPLMVRRHPRAVVERLLRINIHHLNKVLPRYSLISGFELMEREFEKTPKRSIKRFMYK